MQNFCFIPFSISINICLWDYFWPFSIKTVPFCDCNIDEFWGVTTDIMFGMTGLQRVAFFCWEIVGNNKRYGDYSFAVSYHQHLTECQPFVVFLDFFPSFLLVLFISPELWGEFHVSHFLLDISKVMFSSPINRSYFLQYKQL